MRKALNKLSGGNVLPTRGSIRECIEENSTTLDHLPLGEKTIFVQRSVISLLDAVPMADRLRICQAYFDSYDMGIYRKD